MTNTIAELEQELKSLKIFEHWLTSRRKGMRSLEGLSVRLCVHQVRGGAMTNNNAFRLTEGGCESHP